MPRHLEQILKNEKIQVLRKSKQRTWVRTTISLMDAFAIKNLDDFFAFGEKVISHFEGKAPEKLERKIGIEEKPSTCSYIKEGDGIYVISREIIGTGSFGTVRLAYKINKPLDTRRHVLKIQAIEPNDAFLDDLIQTEAELGYKIGYFSQPLLQRNLVGKRHQNKYYLISLYGGITLTQWINEYNPSDESRLKVAISLCQQVLAFHEKGYAHGDLKPDNVLIDPTTEAVSLADIGFIGPLRRHPSQITMKGSLSGLPFFETDSQLVLRRELLIRMQALGVLRLETLALMRILDTPFHGPEFKEFGPSLLSANLLNPLYGWIDTSSEEACRVMPIRNPLALLTLLILHFYEQDLNKIMDLKKASQQAIARIYTDGNASEETKKERICSVLYPQAVVRNRNPVLRFRSAPIDEAPIAESPFSGLLTSTPVSQGPTNSIESSPSKTPSRFALGRARGDSTSPFFAPSPAGGPVTRTPTDPNDASFVVPSLRTRR